MSTLKARIFDVVERSGIDGIDRDELFEIALSARGVKRSCLKTHISQINDLLAGTDFQIRCGHGNLAYVLMKV